MYDRTKYFYILLFLCILHLESFAQTKIQIVKVNGIDAVKSEIIIKFKSPQLNKLPTTTSAIRISLIQKYNARSIKRWNTGAELWQLKTDSLNEVINELRKNPAVEYAEPNYIVKAASIQPNDPFFNNQWGLYNQATGYDINATNGWIKTEGDTTVLIGEFDTGIDYNHPDLSENIWRNWNETPNDSIDNDGNGYIDDFHGWNFISNNNDPMDDNGHGTHVAGIIGAKGNNGIGVAGVAWNCKLVPLKVLDNNGQGPMSALINAIEYCEKMNIKIINMSLGSVDSSSAEYDALNEAQNYGILIIAAAGNYSENTDYSKFYPADFELPNIISVASINSSGNLSSFSDYGMQSVDIAAPGENIYSSLPNDSYGYMSGTSMAAPFVTGEAALIKSEYKDYTNIDIKNQILNNVRLLSSLNSEVSTGGIIDLGKALSNQNIWINTSAAEINLPTTKIGQQSTKELELYNTNTNSITIDSIYFDNSEYNISTTNGAVALLRNIIINSKDSSVFTIVYNPISQGLKYSNLIIAFNSGTPGNNLYKRVLLRSFGIQNGTVINQNSIYGVLSSAGSPYYIDNDISVGTGQELIIQPGDRIIFTNHYRITVGNNAILIAKGAPNDSIYFSPIDSTIGWNGLNILNSQNDDTLEYCIFAYSKKLAGGFGAGDENNGGGAVFSNSDTYIKNCSFQRNYAIFDGAGLKVAFPNNEFVLDSCSFIGNRTGNFGGGGALLQSLHPVLVKNCIFESDTSMQGTLNIQIDGFGENQLKEATIFNNKFYRNVTVDGGSAIYIRGEDGFAIFRNLIHTNNDYCPFTDGGTIMAYSNGKGLIYNNTIANNIGGQTKTAIFIWDCDQTEIVNNILWNIGYQELFTVNSNSIFNEYNITNSATNDSNNIIQDPLFKDTLSFALNNNSPALNSGMNLGIFRNEEGNSDIGYTGGNCISIFDYKTDFNTLGINDTRIDSIVFYNMNNFPLTIDSMTTATNASIINNTKNSIIYEDGRYTIQIQAQPKQVGTIIDSLKIYSKNLVNGEFELPYSMTGILGNTIAGIVTGTLTSENSPYIVTSDITVPAGNELDIEPNTKILFFPDSHLIVNGTVNAKGTTSNPIIFDSYSDTSKWQGLNFSIGSNSELNYCLVRNFTLINIFNSITTFNNTEFENGSNYSDNNNILVQSWIANFNNCKFINNNAGYLINSQPGCITTLRNCLFTNNNAVCLLANYQSTLNIINSTFLNNNITSSSDGKQYIFYSEGGAISLGNTKLINSIIYNNYDAYFYFKNVFGNNSIEFINSDIRGGIGVILNNSTDIVAGIDSIYNYNPLFADTLGHLSSSSNCIDGGSNDTTNLSIPLTDLDGNARIWNSRIDIGAYEYGSKPLIVTPLGTSWNLIGFNNKPFNDTTQKVFSNVLSNTVIIMGYDNGAQVFYPAIDTSFSNLSEINYLQGYWVKMNKAEDFYNVGDKVNPQTPINLNKGWNLISYLPTSADSIRHALSGILSDIITVMGFDNGGFTFDPLLSDTINTLNVLQPNKGYWIKVNKADTLIFPAVQNGITKYSNHKIRAELAKTKSSKVIPTNEWISLYSNNLRVNGSPVTVGTEITAVDPDGVVCGDFIVKKAGTFGLMPIYRDDFTTAKVEEGAKPGDAISLFVDTYEIPVKITWSSNGDIIDLGDLITNIDESKAAVPDKFDISQNYPNPFNPATKIKYQLPKAEQVTITIYNILGQIVKRLVYENQEAGYYTIEWDGRNNINNKVATGVYIYRIRAGNFIESKKMILLK